MTEQPPKNNQPIFSYTVIPIFTLIIGMMIGAFGYDAILKSNTVQEQIGVTSISESAPPQMDQYELARLIFDSLRTGQPPPVNPNRRFAVDIANSPTIGSPDAPIVMIEFSDFQCGFCKRFHDQTFQPLLDEYGDQILFVYRDMAILGQTSIDSALAAQCAFEQDQFWEMHDLLFANPQDQNQDSFLGWAEELGLDVDAFTTCLDETRYLDNIQEDTQTAQSLGATGTPTFYINGRYISGAQPLAAFVRVIEEELQSLSETQ